MDGLNELTNALSANYLYDSNGNPTNFGGVVSTYDAENRLAMVSDDTAHTFRTGFVYDGRGRLRARQRYDWVNIGPASIWILTADWHYLYDGMRVIQERIGTNSSNLIASYTRGTDLSGSLEGAGGIGGLLGVSKGYSAGNWTTHYCYHADGNGNITYLEDSSQALAASYRYDPYGNVLSSSGSMASINLYRFSSKEVDANTGLYYYGYRWYDPNLQRWLNRDPMGEEGSYNLYAFALNAPLSYIDPFGDDLIPTPLHIFDPGGNRERSRQFNRGCVGLCSWYQSEGCGKPKDYPEDASNTKCFSSKSQAEGYKCPDSKTPFIFAKQGNWKDGKPPKPKSDGRVPNDSIGGNETGDYNYVTCMGGNYYWMNRHLDIHFSMPTVYVANQPPSPNRAIPMRFGVSHASAKENNHESYCYRWNCVRDLAYPLWLRLRETRPKHSNALATMDKSSNNSQSIGCRARRSMGTRDDSRLLRIDAPDAGHSTKPSGAR